MSSSLVPVSSGAAPPPKLTSYRYWEGRPAEELRAVRAKLDLVLDDMARQFDLFGPPGRGDAEGNADFGAHQEGERSMHLLQGLAQGSGEIVVADGAEENRAAVLQVHGEGGVALGAVDGQPRKILHGNGQLANQGAHAATVADTTLGSLLSPSQANCYLMCSAKWWFKYGLGLPDPKGGSLVRGLAVHKVIETWFRATMAGAAPEIEDMREPYDAAWDALSADASFAEGDDIGELKRQGAALLRRYLEDVAPQIRPAKLEQRVVGEIGGVKVQGYIDILDVDGRVIDVKTAAKSPSRVDPSYAFQLATYRQLCPGASGKVRLDTLVATKTPKVVTTEYEVTAADQLMTQTLYPRVREGIREGLYLPNRGCNLCSRKYCNFAGACEKEFGGHVE